MFLTEMHMHTSEASVCAEETAAEAVEIYRSLGYKTLVVSDHMAEWYTRQPNFTDKFLSGWRAVRDAAKPYGMNVLLAMELKLTSRPNDYLIYGATEDLFYENPDLPFLSEAELHSFAKKNGLLIVQAHPFRRGCEPADPKNIDGMEVWNGHPGWYDCEQEVKAEKIADEFGLIKTAGSDFHGGGCIAGTGLLFPEEIKDWETALSFLKSGNYEVKKSSVFEKRL